MIEEEIEPQLALVVVNTENGVYDQIEPDEDRKEFSTADKKPPVQTRVANVIAG